MRNIEFNRTKLSNKGRMARTQTLSIFYERQDGPVAPFSSMSSFDPGIEPAYSFVVSLQESAIDTGQPSRLGQHRS